MHLECYLTRHPYDRTQFCNWFKVKIDGKWVAVATSEDQSGFTIRRHDGPSAADIYGVLDMDTGIAVFDDRLTYGTRV